MNIEEIIQSIPFAKDCFVINFHDCGLLAIYKKSGRASHPNRPSSKVPQKGATIVPMILAKYNLQEEYYTWIDEITKEKVKLYLINRLDSPTSGVILAATNPVVAEAAKQAFANKEVKKTYFAICVGRCVQKYGKWIEKIREFKGEKFVRGKADPTGQMAITKFDIEEHDKNAAGLTLVKLEPETGLTHQLRIQCATHKMPILGDATYGNFQANKRFRAITKVNRLFLHCAATEIDIEINGEKIHFEAESPIPASFSKLMEFNPDIIKRLH